MKTKRIYLYLLLLVMSTANVWADKYYKPAGDHTNPTRHSELWEGMKFFIYNTAYKSYAVLNERLDYTPKNVARDLNRTRSDRYIRSVSISGSTADGKKSYTLTSAEQKKVYTGKTGEVFVVNAGETITPRIDHDGTWINAAVFIDYNADGFAITKSDALVQPSTTLPTEGKPEFVYHIKNANSKYATSTTGIASSYVQYGQFAFYASKEEGVYYIYSLGEQKWLGYTVADSYSNCTSFITLHDSKDDAQLFKFVNFAGNKYEIHPYKADGTPDALYLNWLYGSNNPIGLWRDSGASDNGSCWLFELIDYSDVVSYSFYSFNENSDVKGYNSTGAVLTDGARSTSSLPSFKAPMAPGRYRMRFLLDYNNINPDGTGERTTGGGSTMGNGGAMVDVVLEVTGSNDYTGFAYNNSTSLGLSKEKANNMNIFNECYVFTLESAGEADAYYIKSLSTGAYLDIFGSTSNSQPQKLYIYSWPQAVTLDTDTYISGGNGAVADNGNIKQAIDVSSEASNYSIIQNSQLIKQDSWEAKLQNPYKVFVVTDGQGNYWNGEPKAFATSDTGHPYAFIDATDVDKNEYADIRDLHIYSRCDLYSAQAIYGYVQKVDKMWQSHPVTMDGETPCDLVRLIDGDFTTYSMTDASQNDDYHYLTFDLGQGASDFYLYMARRADAKYAPTIIEVSVANSLNEEFTPVPDSDAFYNDITNGCLNTGLDTKLEYFSPYPVELGGNYRYVRIKALDCTSVEMCMALSELYILPNKPVIQQALTYQQVSLYNTKAKYTVGIDELNATHPEVKILSGVPIPGNKYRMYADAYDAERGMYVNYDIYIKATVTDDVTTYTLANDGDYDSATADEKKYYEWVCEQLPNGKLVFRNPKTGKYLANGVLADTSYIWDYNTNQTYRHGVPLIDADGKYLAVGTAVSDGTRSWMTDVWSAQNQTTYYTYLNNGGTPDNTEDDVWETDYSVRACTDFVFLPIENTANEKKVNVYAAPLAVRNSIFRYNSVQYTLPFAHLFEQTELPIEYEFLCTIKNLNGIYATATTGRTTNAADAAVFAFCKHATAENGYYIYSVSESKWLTYDVAESYSSGQNKISLSDTKNEAAYFILADQTNSGTSGKDISPVTTAGTKADIYFNWYGGGGDTMGFYTTNGSGDKGSLMILAFADNRVTIEELCGSLHRFQGFYKMNEDEPTTTEKLLTYNEVEDGGYYEARFRFDKPFEQSVNPVKDADGNVTTPGSMKYYKIKNLATGKYLTYISKNKKARLVDESNLSATSLFYFTEVEYDGSSHVRAYIESAICGNKLYDEGNASATDTVAHWNTGGRKYYVQPNHVSGAAEGKREGFAISRDMLNETNNPTGLSSGADGVLVGTGNVNNAGALWVFEPADDAKAMLEAYIGAMVAEINGWLNVQHLDYDEEANPGVPDTKYPVYDERKIQYHRDYVSQLQQAAAASDDLVALGQYAEELYSIYVNIQSTTLALPVQTIKWDGNLDAYHPKWYYIRNVKDSHDKQADRAAKYVGDEVNMEITTLEEGNKSLAHLFYVGGGVHQEGTVYEHLDNCCIHNFAAHYHDELTNDVVDKTLVSENETLFENLTLIGNGEIVNNINGIQTLRNETSWRIVLEGKSNGNSYNAWGSCLLSSLDNPIADNYTNNFQIYMKADGYIIVKTSSYDGTPFDHIRGAYDTFKVELLWTPNVYGSTAEKVSGKLDIFVTNSVGTTQTQTLSLEMKDLTVFSSALPKGMDITALKAEEVKMLNWNEQHTDSNWFILPTTNTVYPGHSIVIGSASTDNLGWYEDKDAAHVINSVGSADYASWEFVKVVDFKEHMEELLDTWNIDECLVYNAGLVELYKRIKTIYNTCERVGNFDEDSFNSMVVAIRLYHGLPVSEYYKPKENRLYTIRPAYEGTVNYAAVNEYNSVVRSEVTNSAGEVNSRGVWMFEGNDSTVMKLKSLHTQSYLVETASDSIVLGTGNATVCLIPLGATEVSIRSNSDYTFVKRHSVGDVYVTSDYIEPDKDYYNRYADVTFTRTGTEVASVTSEIVGEFAKMMGDATAELVSVNGASLKATANSLTESIICPDVNGNNHANVELVFCLNNLPAGFSFNNVSLDIHALTSTGAYQYKNDGLKRLWNVAVSVADSEDALATAPVLASLNDIDIAAGVGETDNVHKLWNVTTDDTYEVNGSCYVKLTITSGSENVGCFFGLSQMILSQEGDTWYIEEITNPQTTVYYPASTTINGHSTLMLGYDAVIPEGVEAFYSTGLSTLPYYLLMTSYNGVLPKNAPVVLRNTDRTATAKDFKFYFNALEGAADNDNGFMAGSLYFTPVQCLDNHNYYMIMKNQDVARMYWVYEEYDENGNIVAPNTDEGGWVVCHANKAYMVLDKTTAQNIVSYPFGFNMNGTTDIDEVEIRKDAMDIEVVETIFDLQGRKLNEITEPGIYIVNGRKVVVE